MILVTAGVIKKDGLIFCARRAMGKDLAGFWEFPGGKVEDKESLTGCLVRELKEEFDINTRVTKYLMETSHHYEDKSIRLMVYTVEHLSGEFKLKDHDEFKWLPVDQLGHLKWSPADLPIVEKLQSV